MCIDTGFALADVGHDDTILGHFEEVLGAITASTIDFGPRSMDLRIDRNVDEVLAKV